MYQLGPIAYGRNYGTTYTSPSGYFQMAMSDLYYPQYRKIKGQGLKPDIFLEEGRDWIEPIKDRLR